MRQTKAFVANALLSELTLPGADTTTKRAALETEDPRLDLMLRESARHGWPNGFSDDLYEKDAEWLTEHPDMQVLWILRENGTHLYPISCETPGDAYYIKQVLEYWSGTDRLNYSDGEKIAHFYLVTHERIKPLSHEQAAKTLKVKPQLAS